MQLEALDALIEKVSNKRNIEKEELIDELADILKLKYDISLMDKERAIIDEVRNKIITRLYNTEDHRIDRSKSDEVRHYKLDALESRFLNTAVDELVHEGILEDDKKSSKLTDAGIMKYKEFYGEI
jgi:hypothetical protein